MLAFFCLSADSFCLNWGKRCCSSSDAIRQNTFKTLKKCTSQLVLALGRIVSGCWMPETLPEEGFLELVCVLVLEPRCCLN